MIRECITHLDEFLHLGMLEHITVKDYDTGRELLVYPVRDAVGVWSLRQGKTQVLHRRIPLAVAIAMLDEKQQVEEETDEKG